LARPVDGGLVEIQEFARGQRLYWQLAW